MLGAIAGDIIGSVYEHHPIKSTDFPLFVEASRFTDDTVLTCAVADAILHHRPYADVILEYALCYPNAGYGERFIAWALLNRPQPPSYGNGSAMRVSPIGWAFDNLDMVLEEARRSCVPSHDHPEGIRGAQAVAVGVFLARMGHSKAGIKKSIEDRFGYDLDTPLDVVRPGYQFDVTCQGSVPVALRSFLEAESFEQAVRLAVSMGGDSDTLACMAGAVAEAAFGMPEWIREEAMKRLDVNLRVIVEEFG
jgi:ADP-ribosylglycohydrolase